MYKYILEQAQRGVQSYLVCPRVDDEEDGDADGTYSAKTLYKELQKTGLKDIGLGLLHGKMKETEKASIMSSFADGEIKVLVTTTVIEVGIDVEAANIIAIFNADRFGLSQLHQLRGRVGRGTEKGFAFLVTASQNPEALERLKILRDNNNGFELSEYDLEMRGAGDFIGMRQHGVAGALQNLKLSKEIIALSR
jgi:ATP-dependent DNA helicase RecG